MNKGLLRVVVILLIGAVGVGLALGFKASQARQLEARTQILAQAIVASMPSYAANAPYLDGLLAAAHPTAWEETFEREMLTGGTVNVSGYQRSVLGQVSARLKADGQAKLDRELGLAVLRAGIGEADAGESDAQTGTRDATGDEAG